jgi:coatomer protein complex subunit gamma
MLLGSSSATWIVAAHPRILQDWQCVLQLMLHTRAAQQQGPQQQLRDTVQRHSSVLPLKMQCLPNGFCSAAAAAAAVAWFFTVRVVPKVIQDSQPGPNGEARPFYEYLESCLRHKSESVIFEVRCSCRFAGHW